MTSPASCGRDTGLWARRMCRLGGQILLLSWVLPVLSQQNAALSTAPILNPEKQGAELAARLRDAAPVEPDEFKGTLEIIAHDETITTIPIVSRITPGPSNWTVVYVASGPRAKEELVITHAAGHANVYTLRTNVAPGTTNLAVETAPSGVRPFAGSDFWVGDLGLEFLHWSGQRVLTNEMRSSRSCWVLESTNASALPGGYGRVLSWVDVEHSGILRADAYAPGGKLLKEFRLGDMRKIDGRYQLESMTMKTRLTDSETKLKFDLPRKD